MTNTELILNMLAEASTKDISAAVEPKDFEESKNVAQQGGNVARQRAGIENRNKGGEYLTFKRGITLIHPKKRVKSDSDQELSNHHLKNREWQHQNIGATQ